MNRNIMSVGLAGFVLAAVCGSTALTRNNATATPGTAALAKNPRDRCATRHIDETTATQYEQALNKFNSKRSPGQIRKSGSSHHSGLLSRRQQRQRNRQWRRADQMVARSNQRAERGLCRSRSGGCFDLGEHAIPFRDGGCRSRDERRMVQFSDWLGRRTRDEDCVARSRR